MKHKLKNISIKAFINVGIILLIIFFITFIFSSIFQNYFLCLISIIFLFLFTLLWLVYIVISFEKKYIPVIVIEIAIFFIINLSRDSKNFCDIISLIFTITSIILVEILKQNKSNAIKSRCNYYYNKFMQKYIEELKDEELKDNKNENDKLNILKFNDMYFESRTGTYSKLLEAFLLIIMLTIIFYFEFSFEIKTFVPITSFLIISYFASKRIDTIYTERKKPLSERYDENFFDADFINLFNSTIPEDLREYFGEYTGNEIIILEGRKTNKKTEEIEKGIKYHFEIVKII